MLVIRGTCEKFVDFAAKSIPLTLQARNLFIVIEKLFFPDYGSFSSTVKFSTYKKVLSEDISRRTSLIPVREFSF